MSGETGLYSPAILKFDKSWRSLFRAKAFARTPTVTQRCAACRSIMHRANAFVRFSQSECVVPVDRKLSDVKPLVRARHIASAA
jgi:hypothetical protein